MIELYENKGGHGLLNLGIDNFTKIFNILKQL